MSTGTRARIMPGFEDIRLFETTHPDTGEPQRFFLLDSPTSEEDQVRSLLGNKVEIEQGRLLSDEENKKPEYRTHAQNTYLLHIFLDGEKIGYVLGGHLYVTDDRMIDLVRKAV